LQLQQRAHGGLTPEELIAMLEGTLKKQKAFDEQSDSGIGKLSHDQKRAEEREAVAREQANKLEGKTREHGIAAQDSQRKLSELGQVKDYPSLGALARGQNRDAQRLMRLQERFANEDPNSIEGRRDESAIAGLKASLQQAGLQPEDKEAQSPLNKALTADGISRVQVTNTD